MLKSFSNEKFDIIVQAGQSNSEGYGIGDTETAFVPNELIWYLKNDFTIQTASEQVDGNHIVGNFSLPFASEYIKNGNLQSGRKLLIIRAAVGGTGFSDKRWGLEDDLFLNMTEMIKTALALSSANRLVAFLWHQGETDAINNATYGTHFKNLFALINTVRNMFKCRNLPFIAADFVHCWKMQNLECCIPVIKAIESVCEKAGNASFIETKELQANSQKVGGEDNIHFSREALYTLGEKYFDAFCKISIESN